MSTMSSNKQMETKLYDLVSCLADNYGFDADEAFEYVRWETEVDHVGGIIGATEKPVKAAKAPKAEKKEEEPVAVAADGQDEKIATCRKNIETWTKKLSSAKDADKQQEKIEKEQKKLEKLLAKAPKVEEKKPEPKKAEPVKKAAEPEKKEKRIKRFSPVMAAQLKTALESVKLEMTDKLKKDFQQYVEDLTDDDYRKEGLAEHMRSFAKLHAPTEAPAEAPAEDSEEETEETEEKLVGDSTVVDVTLKELQSISMTATVEPMGTFWDADKGRFVKGPEADDDEDFEEMKFEGTTYVVGEKTGRVYEARDSGDIFAGFVGVGKFKKMTK
jgi:hypothetical protein